MRCKNVMTPEEVAEWSRATGSRPPDLTRREGPRARITLDLGEKYGRAVLGVTCDEEWQARWAAWMRERMERMGGKVDER